MHLERLRPSRTYVFYNTFPFFFFYLYFFLNSIIDGSPQWHKRLTTHMTATLLEWETRGQDVDTGMHLERLMPGTTYVFYFTYFTLPFLFYFYFFLQQHRRSTVIRQATQKTGRNDYVAWYLLCGGLCGGDLQLEWGGRLTSCKTFVQV
jgi:hypothetical protein